MKSIPSETMQCIKIAMAKFELLMLMQAMKSIICMINSSFILTV